MKGIQHNSPYYQSIILFVLFTPIHTEMDILIPPSVYVGLVIALSTLAQMIGAAGMHLFNTFILPSLLSKVVI